MQFVRFILFKRWIFGRQAPASLLGGVTPAVTDILINAEINAPHQIV